MDIRHLRYFVAVAEALSFAKAARALHMSQPPLSKRIAEMEESLGTRLFDRSSKKVALTAAGEVLLPQAREAVTTFDSAVRVARALSPLHGRTLRVAMPIETSRSALLEVVTSLHRQGVEVNMSEAGSPEQRRLLADGEIDLGVLSHPFDSRGLRVSAPLAQPLGVLMHRSHPLAVRKRLGLPDLAPFALVLFHRHVHPGLHDELLELCSQGGYVPPKILYGVKLTAALLADGDAVTLAPERLAGPRSRQGGGEWLWKPLHDEPVHWWRSAVCRTQEWNDATRLAMEVTLESLERHDGWMPLPRPQSSKPVARHFPDVGSSAS